MNLAFAQVKDFSTRIDRGSGTWAYLCREIERQGQSVHHLHAEGVRAPLATRALKALSRRLGWRYRSYEDPFLGGRIGRDLSRRLEALDCDVVLSNNLLISAYVKTPRPIVVYTDTLFPFDYRRNVHPRLDRLAPYAVAFSQYMTRRGLEGSAVAVFPARWCLDEAEHYVPEIGDKSHVIPFGANLAEVPGASCADRRSFAAVAAKESIELLFVGQDWQRKGGEVAVATLGELARRGIAAALHVVGPELAENAVPPNVERHGFLDKRDPQGSTRLDELYRRCDVFLLPTRIEGFGIAAAEAAAYGMPVLAYRAQGISDVVADGESGLLLDPAAGPVAFANAIEAWYLTPGFYDRLARRARHRFEQELNWTTAVGRLLCAIRRCGFDSLEGRN